MQVLLQFVFNMSVQILGNSDYNLNLDPDGLSSGCAGHLSCCHKYSCCFHFQRNKRIETALGGLQVSDYVTSSSKTHPQNGMLLSPQLSVPSVCLGRAVTLTIQNHAYSKVVIGLLVK
jgi:hypothetical protein